MIRFKENAKLANYKTGVSACSSLKLAGLQLLVCKLVMHKLSAIENDYQEIQCAPEVALFKRMTLTNMLITGVLLPWGRLPACITAKFVIGRRWPSLIRLCEIKSSQHSSNHLKKFQAEKMLSYTIFESHRRLPRYGGTSGIELLV